MSKCERKNLTMIRQDEGYIKFNLSWRNENFYFSDNDFITINSFRNSLYKQNLIGAYSDGIGFGNVSLRMKNSKFIISGSATGNIETLKKEDYSLITDFDIKNNSVTCIGLTKASSESMSHAAIYEANKNVNSVIHIHHKKMWNIFLDKLPTTNKNGEFGTPEIALEIKKLTKKDSGIIIMGGHPEGIISYGNTINQAYKILIEYYNKI